MAREEFAAVAQKAAAATVANPIGRFAPGSRLSTHAYWFVTTDDAVLIAVVPPGKKFTIADEVLAYGLAWQGNRDLHLVVPEPMLAGCLARLPWVETTVRVWVLDSSGPTEVHTLPEFEVFERIRDLPPRISKRANLTPEQGSWLAGLNTTGLEPHDRSYLSWHHQGLQVLKASRTRDGLRIQAGVQYSKPSPDLAPYNRVFSAAPTPEDLQEINSRVAQAVGYGGSKTSQMREHRMQAALASQASDLGLVHLLREFPAYRGLDGSDSKRAGRPGYIDFLGVDAEGHFHVVETKIGHDPRVVLQALDYGIWVRANEIALRSRLRAEGRDIPDPKPSIGATPLHMHLVLGPSGNGTAFNGYLAPQIEALSADCDVRVYLVPDPASCPLSLTRLSPRDVWTAGGMVAAPVMPPRYPDIPTPALAREGDG